MTASASLRGMATAEGRRALFAYRHARALASMPDHIIAGTDYSRCHFNEVAWMSLHEAAVAHARRQTLLEALRVLRAVEWAGPHHDPALPGPSCHMCRRMMPMRGDRPWTAEKTGHSHACPLARLLGRA